MSDIRYVKKTISNEVEKWKKINVHYLLLMI